MIRLPVFISVLMLACAGLWGQSPAGEESPRSWGKVHFSPGFAFYDGDSRSLFGAGGAWEGLISGRMGVNVDLGYLAPFSAMGDGIGTFSPGILYAFGDSATRPYATGGYTLFFRSFAEHGVFFGGGVNHWVSKSWGIGFEVRDQVAVSDNVHFVQFRVALLID